MPSNAQPQIGGASFTYQRFAEEHEVVDLSHGTCGALQVLKYYPSLPSHLVRALSNHLQDVAELREQLIQGLLQL